MPLPLTTCGYFESELKSAQAKVITSLGEFCFELLLKERPMTCWNFINLVEGRQTISSSWKRPANFYQGLEIFSIIPNHSVGMGSPSNQGLHGPGYQIDLELDPPVALDFEGAVVAPGEDGRANGSQFFVNLSPIPNLIKRVSLFGRLVRGKEIVEKISQLPARDHRPIQAVTVRDIVIIRK